MRKCYHVLVREKIALSPIREVASRTRNARAGHKTDCHSGKSEAGIDSRVARSLRDARRERKKIEKKTEDPRQDRNGIGYIAGSSRIGRVYFSKKLEAAPEFT